MSNRRKKKVGAKAIIARIIVVILAMAAGGTASFFGSKAFFANRFKKDKKAEIAAQLKEESKERVDVALIQTGNSMTIRIYHNKNQQMIYVPLRSDLVLTLNDEGKKAVEDELGISEDKATVFDLIKSTSDGKLMKEQVEKTLGISINSYETINQKNFVKLMNQAEEVKVNLDESITYEDATEKSVTLPAGKNTLNGNAIYALLTDSTIFTDEDAHMTLAGDILVEISKALKEKSLSEYKEYVEDYYSQVKSNLKYDDVSESLERIYGINDKDFNYKILEGTQSGDKFELDTEAAKKVFDEILSESGDLEEALATTESSKKKEDQDSSKNITIEIQNSTQISGLAGRWKDKLSEEGYTVGSVKTNRQGELTHTKIIVEEKDMGQDLKNYFKDPEYEVGTVVSGAKICIIVGTEDEI